MDFFRYNLLRSPEHPYEVFEDECSACSFPRASSLTRFGRTELFLSPPPLLFVSSHRAGEESAFYCTLIDDEGGFRRDDARAGTRVWEKDTLHSGIVLYLQELRVEPEYQRQGVATWALEQIWGLRTFIFAVRPVYCLLVSARTAFSDCSFALIPA